MGLLVSFDLLSYFNRSCLFRKDFIFGLCQFIFVYVLYFFRFTLLFKAEGVIVDSHQLVFII